RAVLGGQRGGRRGGGGPPGIHGVAVDDRPGWVAVGDERRHGVVLLRRRRRCGSSKRRDRRETHGGEPQKRLPPHRHLLLVFPLTGPSGAAAERFAHSGRKRATDCTRSRLRTSTNITCSTTTGGSSVRHRSSTRSHEQHESCRPLCLRRRTGLAERWVFGLRRSCRSVWQGGRAVRNLSSFLSSPRVRQIR